MSEFSLSRMRAAHPRPPLGRWHRSAICAAWLASLLVLLPVLLASGTKVSAASPALLIDEARAAGVAFPTMNGNQPTLLESYTLTGGARHYDFMKYQPRRFAAGLDPDLGGSGAAVTEPGPYKGWDVLNTPNRSSNKTLNLSGWLSLRLNRAATVTIVWRATTRPAWLASWARGADVKLKGVATPTYTKKVAAGDLTLGSVYDTPTPGTILQDTYLVLFAEASGAPSPTPVVPTGRQVPVANQPCPAWVHDQYVATGPDSKQYPTWHPQIDAYYWCYFGHEHGSNPAYFDPNYKELFGYAGIAMGMVEAHAGFKNYVFDDAVGHLWLIQHHFGSATLQAACGRYHELDIAVRDKATGALLADLHYMGDFGISRVNTTLAPLTPPGCPTQGAMSGTTGARHLPVSDQGAVGYEPWRLSAFSMPLGLQPSVITFNTPDPIVICNTAACDTAVSTGGTGSFRHFQFNPGFGVVAVGGASGTFYTDAHGQQLLAAGAPGAVRQFIKPGLNLRINMPSKSGDVPGVACYDIWGFGQPYECSTPPPTRGPANREASLRTPN